MRHNGQSRSFRLVIESLEDRWVPANVGTGNQNYVDQLYRDVLHREADAGGLAYWSSQLDNGEDREDVVDGILNSEEGRRAQVNDLYIRFLGRPADEAGLAYWSNYLNDEDNDNLDLAAKLIGSDEYYQTQGGGTNQGFLNAVYQDVLGRDINPDEVSDRGDDFEDGAEDREDIAEDILESDEAEDARAVQGAQAYLGATTITADQVDDIADDDEDDAAFARSLLTSDAYYNRAQTLTAQDFATIPASEDLSSFLTGTGTNTGTTAGTNSTTGTNTTSGTTTQNP